MAQAIRTAGKISIGGCENGGKALNPEHMVSELSMQSCWIRFGRSDLVILSLLILGWVCPSTFPPNGLVFGSSGLPKPDFYLINVYVGAGRWFSQAVVVERTWEWIHGHSWPVGPWLSGYCVSLFVPISAGLIIFSRNSRVFVGLAWAWTSVWLTATWLKPFSNLAQYDWQTWVLLSVFAAYWILLWSRWFWSAKLDHAERISLVARYSMLFYPIWLLTLTITQGLYPFIGWALTSAGCILLALHTKPAVVATTQMQRGS